MIGLASSDHLAANCTFIPWSVCHSAGAAGVLELLRDRGELNGAGSLRAVEWAGRTNDMKAVALQVTACCVSLLSCLHSELRYCNRQASCDWHQMPSLRLCML